MRWEGYDIKGPYIYLVCWCLSIQRSQTRSGWPRCSRTCSSATTSADWFRLPSSSSSAFSYMSRINAQTTNPTETRNAMPPNQRKKRWDSGYSGRQRQRRCHLLVKDQKIGQNSHTQLALPWGRRPRPSHCIPHRENLPQCVPCNSQRPYRAGNHR